jgi:hypothetical protein
MGLEVFRHEKAILASDYVNFDIVESNVKSSVVQHKDIRVDNELFGDGKELFSSDDITNPRCANTRTYRI